MPPAQQLRNFKTLQDWDSFFVSGEKRPTPQELLDLRMACYNRIVNFRKRPLLVYAAKFWDIPREAPISIDLSDVEAFTDLTSSIESPAEEVDVLLHSPGGSPDATERIVSILRSRFKRVHFLIPHSAYSAATMLALSGDSIVMHPSATLGPIDPQINGIPARSIEKGFEKIKTILAKEGPETLPAYIPLLGQYSLHLFELCADSQKLSKELVSTWLNRYMFKDKKEDHINRIVDFFSNYDIHLMHSRPLMFDKLKDLELTIELASGPLCEHLWEAYIMINGFFRVSEPIPVMDF